MFSGFVSSEAKRVYGDETSIPIDKLDAAEIQKAVTALPDKHMRAIGWCYLRPTNPQAQARELGVSLQGLADLIHNGRTMLVNRKV